MVDGEAVALSSNGAWLLGLRRLFFGFRVVEKEKWVGEGGIFFSEPGLPRLVEKKGPAHAAGLLQSRIFCERLWWSGNARNGCRPWRVATEAKGSPAAAKISPTLHADQVDFRGPLRPT